MSDHHTTHDRVRAQFAKTAAGYVTSRGHAKGAELGLMVEQARERFGDLEGVRVLDVATGGGHTALAFARAGAEVVATDLTPEMLTVAEAFIAGENPAGPVTFGEAHAEALPFVDASFEVVSCRIAAHHFADPQAFVREAARVIAPGGLLMLVDNIVPADAALAAIVNRIEKERDPSHVEAYPLGRWLAWLEEAGLELHGLSRWTVDKPYRDWLERAHTPAEVGEGLAGYVLDLPERTRRYLRVAVEGDRLASLAHEAALLVALKTG